MDEIENNYKGCNAYNILAVVVHDKITHKLRNNKRCVKKSLEGICTLEDSQLFKLMKQKASKKHLLKACGKKGG